MTETVPSDRTDHVERLRAVLQDLDPALAVVEEWGHRLAGVLAAGGRLLAAGNGGSAAQAQHLTAELVGRYRDERRPLSAVCLSAETSTLTALANDYPIEELFARQVEAHGRPGDVVVLMSTSGRSPNLVEAARRARRAGLRVWALTGPVPSPLAVEADEVAAVEAGETCTVQEAHLVLVHRLCAALDAALADEVAALEAAELPAELPVAAGSPR